MCCEAENDYAMFFAGLGTASSGQSGTGTAWPALFSPSKNRSVLRDEEATLMTLASFGGSVYFVFAQVIDEQVALTSQKKTEPTQTYLLSF